METGREDGLILFSIFIELPGEIGQTIGAS
jgi:hypothetical protein